MAPELKERLYRELMQILISLEDGAVKDAKNEIESAGGQEVEFEKNLVRFEIRGSVDKSIKALANYEVLEFDSRELSLEEVFFSEVQN